jgi:hypothetical protein
VRDSKNELDVDSIADRDTVGADAWPESQRKQNIPKLPVVSAIRRWIEAEELRVSLFIDIEIRDEVVALQ